MGRRKATKLYLSTKEWKESGGGMKEKKQAPKSESWLRFEKFAEPVCTVDGTVFEKAQFLKFVRKNGVHPVTGKPGASERDFIVLHAHRNTDGEYICPVTYKVFTPKSHIVTVRTTGHVYLYEAVKQLNLDARCYEDLMDGTKFDPSVDLITLQDPQGRKRAPLDQLRAAPQRQATIQVSAATRRVLSKLQPTTGTTGRKRARSDGAEGSGAGNAKKRAVSVPSYLMTNLSTHATAASFTSTAAPVSSGSACRPMNAAELLQKRYRQMKARAQRARKAGRQLPPECAKGLVVFELGWGRPEQKGAPGPHTGTVACQLHCDLVPRACHNFLLLAGRGYYDGLLFHRLVPGFCLQGGDPTGTGTGGQSAWGAKPFADEFTAQLSHAQGDPPVLSMANSGPNTNRSQFFFTLGPAPHLDGKHTLFGEVLEGADVLRRIEGVPCGRGGDQTRPRHPVTLLRVRVVQNPFTAPWEWDEAVAERRAQQAKQLLDARRRTDHRWYSSAPAGGGAPGQPAAQGAGHQPAGSAQAKGGVPTPPVAGGIGKYLPAFAQAQTPAPSGAAVHGDAVKGNQTNDKKGMKKMKMKKKKKKKHKKHKGDKVGFFGFMDKP